MKKATWVFSFLLIGFELIAQNIFGQDKLKHGIFTDMLVIDGHTHDPVPRKGSAPVQAGIKRLLTTGIDGIILSFPLNSVGPGNLFKRIKSEMDYVKKYASENNAEVMFTDKFSQIISQKERKLLQIIPAIEYFDGLFDENLNCVEQMRLLCIKSVTLDDNSHDQISVRKNGKLVLNEFGRKVVSKLNEAGIKVDISHLAESLQLDIIKISTKPVFASHSNVRAVAGAGRNLSDEVLYELTKKGGIVLTTFDKEFLFGTSGSRQINGISKLVEHIKYAAKKYGIDHVGIGSDYGGSGKNTTRDLFGIECFSLIAEELMKSGFTIDEVNKITGQNINEYFIRN